MLKCKLGNVSLVVHLRLQYNPYKQLVSHKQDAWIAYNLKEQKSKSLLFLISIFSYLFVFSVFTDIDLCVPITLEFFKNW